MKTRNPQLLLLALCQAPEDIEQLLLVEGDLSTKRWGQSWAVRTATHGVTHPTPSVT